MADDEIPMIERGDGNEDEDEGQGTSFGGGNVMEGSIARERGARPKTKTKTKNKTSSHTNSSFEVELGLYGSDYERKESQQGEAGRRILEKYPDWNPKTSRFVATIDEKDRVTVSLIKGRKIDSKPYVLFKEDGTLRSDVPRTIVKDLGRTTFEIVDERDALINELSGENEGLRLRIKGEKSMRENANLENREKSRKLKEKIKEGKAKISDLEDENKRSNEEKERLKEENERLREGKDEDLKRAKENNEAEVERLKKTTRFEARNETNFTKTR